MCVCVVRIAGRERPVPAMHSNQFFGGSHSACLPEAKRPVTSTAAPFLSVKVLRIFVRFRASEMECGDLLVVSFCVALVSALISPPLGDFPWWFPLVVPPALASRPFPELGVNRFSSCFSSFPRSRWRSWRVMEKGGTRRSWIA